MLIDEPMLETSQEGEAREQAKREAKIQLAMLLAEKVRRAEATEAKAKSEFPPAYLEFQRTYKNAPGRFVKECIRWPKGQGPKEYQVESMEELVAKGRACIRGPHTLGKTAVNAWIILWFSLTRDGEDWKCPTTASAWRQLEKFLWPEVHKWARRLNWSKIGRSPFDPRTELHGLSLRLATGEAFALASDKAELIEGAHADHLLYILDEAKAIPDAIWDAVEGAFAGEGEVSEALALASSTPGEPKGKFYDIQRRAQGTEDWKAIFVTFERVLAAGRISKAWADQRARAWGELSAVFLNRVKGEFAAGNEDGIIPLAWIEAANLRWQNWKDADDGRYNYPYEWTGLGVDVGMGGDASTAARRYGKMIASIDKKSTPDTMQLVGLVDGILKNKGGYAIVDVLGVGAGSVHRLQEKGQEKAEGAQKYAVYAFGAGEHTDATDSTGEIRFINKRAHMWWNLRELLDPSLGGDLMLPPDDELTGDLTAPKYTMTSNGIKVQEKKEIRKDLGRSPDEGESVCMAFYPVLDLKGPAGRVMDYYKAAFDKIQKEKEDREKERQNA